MFGARRMSPSLLDMVVNHVSDSSFFKWHLKVIF